MADASEFSSPFLGTFFQLESTDERYSPVYLVFVPFLGDFLSIIEISKMAEIAKEVFVPFLGDFLSMNAKMDALMATLFSSPFLGTFFQSQRR